MKARIALAASLVALAAAQASPAATIQHYGIGVAGTGAHEVITDTLGGNGHPQQASAPSSDEHDPWWYRYALAPTRQQTRVPFITDTLGGNGHAQAAAQGYRFITDTLAPGGGSSLAAAPSSIAFNWADAGVGAGVVAGALALLAGGLLAVRRRDAIPI